MVTSLFKHERIRTTDAKAKELRRWADNLITLAKRGDLHARRQALSIVREKDVVHKLFLEAAEKYGAVSGGYTRIIKLGRRAGDAAPISMVELITPEKGKKKKTKKKKKVKPAVEKKQVAKKKAAEKEKTAEEQKAIEEEKEVKEKEELQDEKEDAPAEAAVESDPDTRAEDADEEPEKKDGETAKVEAAKEEAAEDKTPKTDTPDEPKDVVEPKE
jgi:large subunit ribosomal protein L17